MLKSLKDYIVEVMPRPEEFLASSTPPTPGPSFRRRQACMRTGWLPSGQLAPQDPPPPYFEEGESYAQAEMRGKIQRVTTELQDTREQLMGTHRRLYRAYGMIQHNRFSLEQANAAQQGLTEQFRALDSDSVSSTKMLAEHMHGSADDLDVMEASAATGRHIFENHVPGSANTIERYHEESLTQLTGLNQFLMGMAIIVAFVLNFSLFYHSLNDHTTTGGTENNNNLPLETANVNTTARGPNFTEADMIRIFREEMTTVIPNFVTQFQQRMSSASGSKAPTVKSYGAITQEKKAYQGRAPKCTKCPFHYLGSCLVCGKCKQTAHFTSYCKAPTKPLNQVPYQDPLQQRQQNPRACSKFGKIEHFMKNCPTKAKPTDNKLPIEQARERAFQIEVGEAKKNPDIVTDLLPIQLGSFDVVIGMDWLSKQKAEVVCHNKTICIPFNIVEMLVVQGEQANRALGLISYMKDQKCLRKGYEILYPIISWEIMKKNALKIFQ
ncbi:hypothetical protein E3N88_23727 [Mikania micrantha]|uniref:Reverse transcriptase domain-containing protein n=1 Tax=Mikania micrantha TaxID=192012 RepID=A0A5N6NE29_9ASTR|nr:hypothetical protein E3N88_23727 [Mikania micrantha]